MITDQQLDYLRALSVTQVVDDYIGLENYTEVNGEYHGPCPFHGVTGKGRSFTINPDKNMMFCFSCGRSYDAFDIARDYYNCDFATAVGALVNKYAEHLSIDDMKENKPLPQKKHVVKYTKKAKEFDRRKVTWLRGLWAATTPISDNHDCRNYWERRGLSLNMWGTEIKTVKALKAVKHAELGTRYPAIVARIRDEEGDTVGMEVRYLELGRKLVAYLPNEKNVFEKVRWRKTWKCASNTTGHHIEAYPLVNDSLLIGEGLETVLSYARMFCPNPVGVWAAQSKYNYGKLRIPDHITNVTIAADKDDDEVGKGSHRLAVELEKRGTTVFIHHPMKHDVSDWNDYLCKYFDKSALLW